MNKQCTREADLSDLAPPSPLGMILCWGSDGCGAEKIHSNLDPTDTTWDEQHREVSPMESRRKYILIVKTRL
jgi:hypothetical protein